MEVVHACYDSLARASDRDGGGLKIAVDTEADRSSQWVHPKNLGVAVSPAQHDGRGGVSCILVWIGAHLQEHVGAHVQGDLEAAMAMAQCLEVYCGAGDGAKAGGEKKGSGKFQKRNKK